MAKFKRIHSSTIVLACLLPFGLTACGSSASAPAAGHSTASKSSGSGAIDSGSVASTGSDTVTSAAGTDATGTPTGTTGTISSSTTDTPLGTAGNMTGNVIESTGNTAAASGASLTNGALNNPLGITVLNNSTPGTGAGNIIDANVLSNTPASAAPVQANALANGQIVSASVAAGQVPVASPLLSGVTDTVNTLPGAAPTLNQVQGAAAHVGSVTDNAAGPLNPLLSLQVGNTQLVGAPGEKSAINADLATPTQAVSASVAQPIPATTSGPLGGALSGGALSGGALSGSPLGGAAGLNNGLSSAVGGITKDVTGNLLK